MNFEPATPVTEGCIVIVTGGDLSGRCFRVQFCGHDYAMVTSDPPISYSIDISCLLRIDGYDETKDRKFNHQG